MEDSENNKDGGWKAEGGSWRGLEVEVELDEELELEEELEGELELEEEMGGRSWRARSGWSRGQIVRRGGVRGLGPGEEQERKMRRRRERRMRREEGGQEGEELHRERPQEQKVS